MAREAVSLKNFVIHHRMFIKMLYKSFSRLQNRFFLSQLGESCDELLCWMFGVPRHIDRFSGSLAPWAPSSVPYVTMGRPRIVNCVNSACIAFSLVQMLCRRGRSWLSRKLRIESFGYCLSSHRLPAKAPVRSSHTEKIGHRIIVGKIKRESQVRFFCTIDQLDRISLKIFSQKPCVDCFCAVGRKTGQKIVFHMTNRIDTKSGEFGFVSPFFGGFANTE